MKYILILILISGSLSGYTQNPAELNRRNGFKTIKLSGPLDSIKGIKFKKDFKERDEFPARLYNVEHEDYSTIGEVKVKEIQLMTYQDLIYKIVITTEKDPRLMKALDRAFGKSVFVVRTATYNWNAENLSLTFKAHKNSLELVYRSHPVIKKMYEDKGKKIDSMADEL